MNPQKDWRVTFLDECPFWDKLTLKQIEWLVQYLGKIEQEAIARERERILKFSAENNVDERIGAFFSGMKIRRSSFIPKDEIWFNDGNGLNKGETL